MRLCCSFDPFQRYSLGRRGLACVCVCECECVCMCVSVCVISSAFTRHNKYSIFILTFVSRSPLFSGITRWVAAGHSLGGIGAASFAFSNPSTVKALVMHAGSLAPFAPFSTRATPVAQIYGTLDRYTLHFTAIIIVVLVTLARLTPHINGYIKSRACAICTNTQTRTHHTTHTRTHTRMYT